MLLPLLMQVAMFSVAIAAVQTAATQPVVIPIPYIGPKHNFISYDWLEAAFSDPRFEELQLAPGETAVDLLASSLEPDPSLMGKRKKRKGANDGRLQTAVKRRVSSSAS